MRLNFHRLLPLCSLPDSSCRGRDGQEKSIYLLLLLTVRTRPIFFPSFIPSSLPLFRSPFPHRKGKLERTGPEFYPDLPADLQHLKLDQKRRSIRSAFAFVLCALVEQDLRCLCQPDTLPEGLLLCAATLRRR
jgi:hypothetical protein